MEMDSGRTERLVEVGWGHGSGTDAELGQADTCAISWARATAGSQLCCVREGVVSVDAACLPSQRSKYRVFLREACWPAVTAGVACSIEGAH